MEEADADGVIVQGGLDGAEGLLGGGDGVADDKDAGSGLGGAGDFLDECGICGVEVLELDGRFLNLGIGDGVMG